ncbi:glycosyltransferase [Sphingomonas sp.]|uniref:glycosyltransferase n=1 Tax=Sphingomonas sp. TaxID=28214 RepID=UPI00286AC32D|nr:glycosyltransferase [Sphingomonas sp.]
MNEELDPGSLAGGVLLTIHRLSQGGADRVAMLLANGFAAAGMATAIAVLRSGGEGDAVLRALLRPDVRVVTAGPPMGSRHLELMRGRRFIRRLTEMARPDHVMASSSNMGLVTGLALGPRGGRGPLRVMKLTNPVIRPTDRGAWRRLYRRTLYRFIFDRYDRIIVLTDAERHFLSRLYPAHCDRFRTAANPYVTDAMLGRATSREPHAAPHILTLARMMPQKRLDRLLTAFAGSSRRDSRLTIVGDGPERPALQRLALKLGIIDRVDMPGFAADVLPFLARTSLFVLSSDYEGLPAAILEALAFNIRVVTTDCFDGARELLDDADGCATVAREDVSALTRAIDDSLALTGTPIGLRDIARRYTIDAGIAAHLAIMRGPAIASPIMAR